MSRLRKCKSQPVPKSGPSRDSTRTRRSHSQRTLEESFGIAGPSNSQSDEKLDEMVHKCVRYVVYKAGLNTTINKIDLQKTVLENESGRQFHNVMEKAAKILKDVYGYNILLAEATGSKTPFYVVCNALPYVDAFDDVEDESVNEDDEDEYPADAHKILVMMVLTHIFMSNGAVTDVSLFSFLNTFDINVDAKHKLFGDLKGFITKRMVKEKYLAVETEEMPKRVVYKFGPRAENGVNKHDLLKFVAKMYKDRNPKSWRSQYQAAEEQMRENELVERMEL